jgi:hypothetical protein
MAFEVPALCHMKIQKWKTQKHESWRVDFRKKKTCNPCSPFLLLNSVEVILRTPESLI